MKLVAALWLSLCIGSTAQATECREDQFDGAQFTICEVDMTSEDLRLFHLDKQGEVYGHFSRINNALAEDGKQLGFAMNAGMYHEDRSPVGLYIENGVKTKRLVTKSGPGNFGLLPNGVLCLDKAHAEVIETRRFAKRKRSCASATQSGPMLVIDGALHPRFLANSDSFYIRNGVGTTQDGKRAIFAISDEPVTFHHFGRLFRDHIGLKNALYFDGSISRLQAPDLGRSDFGFTALGPIIGVVKPAK